MDANTNTKDGNMSHFLITFRLDSPHRNAASTVMSGLLAEQERRLTMPHESVRLISARHEAPTLALEGAKTFTRAAELAAAVLTIAAEDYMEAGESLTITGITEAAA